MSAHDGGAEIASVLGLTLSGLSKEASDLYFWSSTEVGLLAVPASLSGTSSMMPQKKNSISLERIWALAGEAAGWGASQLGMLHYAASTDSDQAYVLNQTPGHCVQTAGAAELLREVLAGIELDVEKMRGRTCQTLRGPERAQRLTRL
jgi:argininosuccinate lyase